MTRRIRVREFGGSVAKTNICKVNSIEFFGFRRTIKFKEYFLFP